MGGDLNGHLGINKEHKRGYVEPMTVDKRYIDRDDFGYCCVIDYHMIVD